MAAEVIGAGAQSGDSKNPGRKSAMRNPVTWIIVLGIAVAGGAYLLYKRSQSSSSASSGTGTSSDTSSTDQTDWAGEIATLQTEIEDLQSSSAQSGSSGTSTTGTSTTGTTTGTTTATKPTTTSTTTAKAKAPAIPTGVKGAAASSSSIKLSWAKVPGATSYQVRVTYQNDLAGSATVSGTSATISGLTADHTYTCHVKACNSGGCSSETNGPTVKTPKG